MLQLGAGTNLGSAYGSVEIATGDAQDNVADLVASVRSAADQMSKSFDDMGRSINSFGNNMKDVGENMTKWVTTPMLGIAAAGVKFSTDFNASMANVASLGLLPERVQELKGDAQEMAVEFGQSTGTMSEGLYQLVSAYGDTEDSQESLRINAQAAAAGLASVTESINLTSAVTKAYGDTSAEAQQKVADLAFETVKLGQTTFPEMAASIGRVTPLAAELGETQEGLFAKTATLTGVTGNAAEVFTQLRATYQAFLAPSEAMAESLAQTAMELDAQGKLAGGPLVDAWRDARDQYQSSLSTLALMEAQLRTVDTTTDEGAQRARKLKDAIKDQEQAVKDNKKALDESAAGLGKAIVQSVGFDETLRMTTKSADGNTAVLNDLFGSVEALNAILALNGAQQDTYQQKLTAMGHASGAAEEAFKAQTQGINALGFTMAQAQAKMEVMMQKLGDGLAPALMDVLTALQPLLDGLVNLANRFAEMDKEQQTVIITIGAVVAAVGPAVMALGTMISVGGTVVSAVGGVVSAISGATGLIASLAAIVNPVGIVVAAVAGLAVAWAADFGGIRTATVDAMNRAGQAMSEWGDQARSTISRMRESMLPSVSEMVNRITGYFGDLWRNATSVFDVNKWIRMGADLVGGLIRGIQNTIGDAVRAVTGFGGAIIDRIREIFGIRSPSTVMIAIAENLVTTLGDTITARSSYALNAANSLAGSMSGIFDSMTSSVNRLPQNVYNTLQGMVDGGLFRQSGVGGATAAEQAQVLRDEVALMTESLGRLTNDQTWKLSDDTLKQYTAILYQSAQKLVAKALEDGSAEALKEAQDALRTTTYNETLQRELAYIMEDGTNSGTLLQRRLIELSNQIDGALGQIFDFSGSTGGAVVGNIGSFVTDLLTGWNQNAYLRNLAGQGGNAPTTTVNGQTIYNFQLDYQTQQSSGSVGQDVVLLNALYGGS